jgi:hypothetical protein
VKKDEVYTAMPMASVVIRSTGSTLELRYDTLFGIATL